MVSRRWDKALLMLLGGLLSPASQADMDITITGNLVIPPCVVNGDAALSVDFGKISREELTAANTPYAAQDVAVPLDCPYNQGAPQLTVTATAVHDAAQGVIQTSKYAEGLVIFLRQQGGVAPLPIGTPTDVTGSTTGTGNQRTLTLNAGVGRYLELDQLTPGAFEATASLLVIYQ